MCIIYLMKKIKKQTIVPDTSIIIEGILFDLLSKKKLEVEKIIIPEAVLSELEAQANKGREIGFIGLEEIKTIKKISDKLGYEVVFYGDKPGREDIKHAKIGSIDAIIRRVAEINNACLFTADKIQAAIAEAKSIDVMFFKTKTKKMKIEKFFGNDTMSLHLREGIEVMAKKGKPGKWQLISIGKKINKEALKRIEKEIIEAARQREDGFIEIDRKHSTVIQIGTYRIVITRPPFSKYYEITIASPIKQLRIDAYNLNEKLIDRFGRAEGILVAGPPGHGKSTFVQALAKFYLEKNKIVKTIEAPRDLVLPKEVTQYALTHSSHDEIRDILLLSRPDYTIFDEMRNTKDFQLYADLRLAGIGLVGVIHATTPIDAIQRFFNRIDLGIIPNVIDTIIFIKDGKIKKVLSLTIKVKVPEGMTSSDLARPVIVVKDYLSDKIEYEIYSFAEQIVVNRIGKAKIKEIEGVEKIAAERIKEEIIKMIKATPDIEFVNKNKCLVYVPKSKIATLIGKKGKRIDALEKKLGISMEVKEKSFEKLKNAEWQVSINKKNLKFVFDKQEGFVLFFINGKEVGRSYFKDSMLKVKRKSMLSKKLFNAIKNKSLEIYYE